MSAPAPTSPVSQTPPRTGPPAAPPAPVASSRPMPRLLKATYLADEEFLLEETRATRLYYFPGPILWILITGVLALFSAAYYYGWFHLGAWTTFEHDIFGGAAHSVGPRWFLIAWGFLFLIGFLWLAVRGLRWVRTVYAVTSNRVIVQTGILGKDFHEIPVTQVRGVDVHQSFGQRILGYGTVRVSSEAGARLGNEDWKGIPKPFRFQKMIEDAGQGVARNAGHGANAWVGR
ncbi:MAG: PH domain-containing protein [Thermoplasmata archaeon]